MSKWKCGICGSKFDNFQAQGFEGTIYCPLCYFKKLYKDTELEREKLENQLQQKENIIKEVREYIEKNTYKIEWGDLEQDNEDINISEDLTDKEFIENLLEILEKVD